MIGSVVPDDMDDALVGVARLDLGEKLRGTDPVDGGRLDEGRVEGLEVYRPCLLYTSPSPRDRTRSRMPSSA